MEPRNLLKKFWNRIGPKFLKIGKALSRNCRLGANQNACVDNELNSCLSLAPPSSGELFTKVDSFLKTSQLALTCVGWSTEASLFVMGYEFILKKNREEVPKSR